MPYGQGSMPLEHEFSYSSLPVPSNEYDTSYQYAQSNASNTANAGQSSAVTNAASYGQSTTHMTQYGNGAPKQPLSDSGQFLFNSFSSPSTQTDEFNGYSSPEQPDFGNSVPFNRPTNVPIMSNLSIADENPQMADIYMTPPVAQTDLTQVYASPNIPQSFQFHPTAGPNPKRARAGELSDEQDGDQQDAKEGARPRLGACNRCKSLKVRCEFKTETDPCKRCLNGGHDCFIPGRKKRRAPPKREVLLTQIREQAAQIQNLMSQLETVNKSTADRSLTPDLLSPLISPALAGSPSMGGNKTPDQNKEAVADWIAKAKESLGAFGAHISMAGASLPRSLLAGNEDDDDDGYYTAYEDDSDDVGIDVEGVEDENPNDRLLGTKKTINRKVSGSSLNGVKKSPGDMGVIIPTKAAPFGLFGDLHRRVAHEDQKDKEDKDNTGIAGKDFFRPDSTPALSHPFSPPIISSGCITPADAEELFKIFFDNMNISVSLLDPVLYTAQRTFLRSPFLFTVICAISSRFYSKRSGLYQRSMHYAQQAAGAALISGKKDVDMCHAYILLSLYPVPAKRWEDQRSWLYLGLALRVATELNLHLPVATIPPDESSAREVLNRARLWLNCFNLDRSTGGQYGKPPTINSMDYQANHSRDWWRTSPFNMRNFDIQLCCYNHDLRTTANFVAKIYNDPESPRGLNQHADFEKLAAETDDELKRLMEEWSKVIKENTDQNNLQSKFRTCLLKVAYSYGRLVVLSYGFQHAFGKNNTDENPFLMRCLNAAEDVLRAVVDDICGDSQLRTYWRHGPEAQSVFVTFASAFLVKLLQPKFATYLPYEKRVYIRNRVQGVVDMLSSIAVDNSHGPKLYAKFLKGLLASPMARLEFQSPATSISSLPRSRTTRKAKSASLESPADSSKAHRSSLSPPPHQDANSFDSFAPMRGAVDPYANGTDSDLTISDLFNPPLNIDGQIIDNLRNIGDAPSWTSFNWLAQCQALQQNLGLDLRASAEIMMEDEQFAYFGAER